MQSVIDYLAYAGYISISSVIAYPLLKWKSQEPKNLNDFIGLVFLNAILGGIIPVLPFLMKFPPKKPVSYIASLEYYTNNKIWIWNTWDWHKIKGVILGSNINWDDGATWTMFENRQLVESVLGKDALKHVYIGDIVFLSRTGKNAGFLAAVKIKKSHNSSIGSNISSLAFDFITPALNKEKIQYAMPFKYASEITSCGGNGCWFSAIKNQSIEQLFCLHKDDAKLLAKKLKNYRTEHSG